MNDVKTMPINELVEEHRQLMNRLYIVAKEIDRKLLDIIEERDCLADELSKYLEQQK